MLKKILITGGSGTVGKALTLVLQEKGYQVAHIGRNADKSDIESYVWDVEKKKIDENCLNGVDTIVHLAGAGIADQRWTAQRKEILIKSRTDSISLLYDLMKRKPHQVKHIISASASGYYSDRGDKLLFESDAPNSDFLGHCSVLWEQAVDKGKELGLRVVKFRTGIVLDKNAGALPQMAKPIQFAVGSPLGSGAQWVSWIHLDDVVNMYVKGIEDETLEGAYNMSSPKPVTNKQLTQEIANTLKKPLWLPNVPAFALKLMLGEMSAIVLGSTKMSTKKIEETGFKFKYSEITTALKNIYG